MVVFFGSVFGLLLGWLANGVTGYSLILTIPVGWFLGVFILSYITSTISDSRLKSKLSNLPSLQEMFDEISKNQKKLTEWERDFVGDISLKSSKAPDYLGTKASIKQVNIIAQIYVERIRGVKLKGQQYTLEATDQETGEIRTITIGTNK